MSILDGLGKYDIGQLCKGRITLDAYLSANRIAMVRREARHCSPTDQRLIVGAINKLIAAARREPNVPCEKCHALSTAIQELAKLERDEQ